MSRLRAFLPVIWATASVLVTVCLLLAIIGITLLAGRVDHLSGQVAANQRAAEALRQQVATLTGVIAAKDQQIISLGGTPSPVPGVTPAPRPSPAPTKTVVRVVPVPGPTTTVTVRPSPTSSSAPRLLPMPLPTLTPLGNSTRLPIHGK